MRFPPPELPFAGDYFERHKAHLDAVLTEPALLDVFRRREALPLNYGIGLDERVVEYPWLLGARPKGRVLDAGSVLNHGHVLDRFLPEIESLTIVTLEPEHVAFPERKVSYVYEDLRDLPFRDDRFDTVVSLSTLEHVGMDNATYGSATSRADDPDAELAAAVAELRRVLKPDGLLLLSVPFGALEDHGWFRQFDQALLDRLLGLLSPLDIEVDVFLYSAAGWQRSDQLLAGSAAYRVATEPVAVDRAAAARAVACIRARPLEIS